MKKRSDLMLVVGLLALATLTYGPAIVDGGFVWDDDDYVTDNPVLRDVSGLVSIWTDPAATVQYYPLTFSSFWVEYRLFGPTPWVYHLVNVLLHGLSAVLFFRLLRSLGVPGAWLAAALFAVHPVHVETVAWVTERKNVLSAAFYLGSALCWVRYFGLDRGDARPVGERPWRYAALGGALFVAALLSKTVTSSLPVSLALLMWWRGRGPRLRHAPALLAMLTAGALAGSLTSFLERHQVGAMGPDWSLGLLERCVVAGRVFWFYLGKLLWPAELIFIYPRWDVSGASGLPWPLAAAGAIAALWLLRGRLGRGPLVAMLHFAVALVPASGFFDVYPMRFSWVADHFQYLASLGPIALAAAGLTTWARRLGWPTAARAALAAILIVGLAGAGWQRARVFRDRTALWEDTLAKNPDAWIAHNNLGTIRFEAGDLEAASRHFLRVIELKPEHTPSRINLGVLRLRQGAVLQREGNVEGASRSFAEAERWLEEAVRLDPTDFNAWANLGDVQIAQRRIDAAESSYLASIRLEPTHPHARNGLGRIRLAQGRVEEAVEHLRVAERASPDQPEVVGNLANALARAGYGEEAIRQYGRLLELDPESFEAWYNRGTLLAQSGRLLEAERHLARAVSLRPDDPRARRNLEMTRRLLDGATDR